VPDDSHAASAVNFLLIQPFRATISPFKQDHQKKQKPWFGIAFF
jgi:hypothetical protein